MIDNRCPHCGEHPSEPMEKISGRRAGDKLLLRIGNNPTSRANLLKVLRAYQKDSISCAPYYIAHYLEGTIAQIENPKK